MARLRVAPAAARDLQKISDEIATAAGKRVALAFMERLRQSLEGLVQFPGMGRQRPAFGSGVRSWVVYPYVAFYRQAGLDVEIIRVVHGRRRITRRLLGAD